MGINIVNIEPGSPEWVIWRQKGIGASVAAAVLNECKFKTAYQLFQELTNRKPAFDGNSATERGTELEPAARAAYEIDNDFVDAPAVCIVHPEYDFIKASLDGWIADAKTIVEIKCPSKDSHEMAMKGEVPRHYWIQMQHQLMCAPEAEVGHYWSFRDSKGVKVLVYPDLAFQKQLLESELAFWELVQSDTPPPLTDRDTKVITDDTFIKDLCTRLIELKAMSDAKEIKAAEAKRQGDLLKSEIIDRGGHRKVRCGGVLVSKSSSNGKDSYRVTFGAANEA